MNPLVQLAQSIQTNGRALILPISIAVIVVIALIRMAGNAVPMLGRFEGSIWAVCGYALLGLSAVALMTWVASLAGGG